MPHVEATFLLISDRDCSNNSSYSFLCYCCLFLFMDFFFNFSFFRCIATGNRELCRIAALNTTVRLEVYLGVCEWYSWPYSPPGKKAYN